MGVKLTRLTHGTTVDSRSRNLRPPLYSNADAIIVGGTATLETLQTPAVKLRFPRTVEASIMRITMSEKRHKYGREFREGAVRIVKETKKPVVVIARDLGGNE